MSDQSEHSGSEEQGWDELARTLDERHSKRLKLSADEPVDLNDLLPKLLAFPPNPQAADDLKDNDYDRQIRSLKRLLEDVPADVLTSTNSNEGSLLDVLNPSTNTLPYAYTLIALCAAAQGKAKGVVKALQPSGALWSKLVAFLESFDPIQIRYAGSQYYDIVDIVYQAALESRQPHLGIEPIRTAMLRLDPATETFTPAHRSLAHLCLLARSWSAALPVLDNFIYHIPTSLNHTGQPKLPPCASHEFSMSYITSSSGHAKKMSYRILLEYYIYTAMNYMGLKNWEQALFYLEACITFPTQNVASFIQVEAYRKYLLVGLIHTGVPLSMPKTTNQQTARQLKNLAKPYEGLAEVFKTGTQDRLRAEIEVGMQYWQLDSNTSLVLQVFAAYRKFAVVRLEQVFVALSITDIMTLIPPSSDQHSNTTETETYIVSLIADGHIKAKLIPGSDPTNTILRFDSADTEELTLEWEEQASRQIAERTGEIKEISKHMRAMGEKLETTKEYVDFLKRLKKDEATAKAKAAEGSNAQLVSGSGAGGNFDDEDVMGDL